MPTGGSVTANPDSFLLLNSQPFTSNVGVLANDSNSYQLPMTANLLQDPLHAATIWRGDGTFDLMPDGFKGPDTLVYEAIVDPGSGPEMASAEVQLLYTGVATWTGAGNDFNWNNPLNWNGHTLPGEFDDVVIDTPGITVVLPEGYYVTIRSLQCAANLNVQGSLTLTAGESLVHGSISVTGGLALLDARLILQGGGEFAADMTSEGQSQLILANGNFVAVAQPNQPRRVPAVGIGRGTVYTLGRDRSEMFISPDVRLQGGEISGPGVLIAERFWCEAGGTLRGTGVLRTTENSQNLLVLHRRLEVLDRFTLLIRGRLSWYATNFPNGPEPNLIAVEDDSRFWNEGTIEIGGNWGVPPPNNLPYKILMGARSSFSNFGGATIHIAGYYPVEIESRGTFSNEGTINLRRPPSWQPSTLTFSRAGNDWWNTGTFYNEGTVAFGAGTYNFSARVDVAGRNQMQGTGSYRFESGSILSVPDGPGSHASNARFMDGAAISGAGWFSANTLIWEGAIMQGTGITEVIAGGLMQINGNLELTQRELRISGAAEWKSSVISFSDNAKLIIDGGTFDVLAYQDNTFKEINANSGTITVRNNGLLKKEPIYYIPNTLTTFEVSVENQGSRVEVDGPVSFGRFTQTGATAYSSLGNSGSMLRWLDLSGGAVHVGSGTWDLSRCTVRGGSLYLANGAYDLSSAILQGGTVQLTGGEIWLPDGYGFPGGNDQQSPLRNVTLRLRGTVVGRLRTLDCILEVIGDLSVTGDFYYGGMGQGTLWLQGFRLNVGGTFEGHRSKTLALEGGTITTGQPPNWRGRIEGYGWINDTYYEVGEVVEAAPEEELP